MTELRLRTAGLEWREIDGEIVALEADTSTYLAANDSGAVLWTALAKGTSRDALVGLLTETFGVDAEEAGKDVDAFLDDLRIRNLLEE